MLSVSLPGIKDLVADVINGDFESRERVWVCARIGRRAQGRGWLGCWCTEGTTAPGEADVREFLNSLSAFLVRSISESASGPVLGDYFFFPGWESWGPGIPKALHVVAVDPYPPDLPTVILEDFG